MESLGFSDITSTWSDGPLPVPVHPTVAEPATDSNPSELADWRPTDIGDRLGGGDVRWSVLIVIAIVVAGLVGLGLWLHQRPQAEAAAATAIVDVEADALLQAIPALEQLNDALITGSPDLADIDITDVDLAARRLFEAGGALPQDEAQTRYLATGAAGSALDGLRLASDARAYVLVISPILVQPDLETDPSVIALDEAARAFGVWQLGFDDVRTALSDEVMPEVTERLDVLSGDLADMLSDYLDALQGDDAAAVRVVLADLGTRLSDMGSMLASSTEEIHARVADRVAETRDTLASLRAG